MIDDTQAHDECVHSATLTSKSLCPPPCGRQHVYCVNCYELLDSDQCWWEYHADEDL
jgi:hypothetical protein